MIRHSNNNDLQVHRLDNIRRLINKVYDESEFGLWKPERERVDQDSLKFLLEHKMLLIAEIEQQIIGCVKVCLVDNNRAEFGMLAVNFQHRNQGFGRKLVNAAEQWAIDHRCSVMQLNLLLPLDVKHPNKEFLQRWYEGMGYVHNKTQPFAEIDPENADYLLMPCEFVMYQKSL